MPIRFRGADKSYYFSTEYGDLQLGDLVVVDSVSGYTIGFVAGPCKSVTEYHSTLELKPILRKPTKSDMINHNYNLKEEKRALEIVAEEIAKLNLPMDLVDAVYTLDGTHITITYTSPEKRVDFRELLKVIVPLLGCKIELRQIAPRDRARLTGGLGICGLPLCCSTFLTNFESITIGMAKNQMLTLNIPKLSGHCGKLICCLAYEDNDYIEAKKKFPRVGTVIHTSDGDYMVDSFNVISRMVRLANAARDDFKTFELEDIIAMQNGTYKEKIVVKKAKEDELPNFGIVPTEAQQESETPSEEQRENQRHIRHRNNRHGRNERPQQQNQGQQQRQDHGQRRQEHGQQNPQKGQKPQQNPNENRPQGQNRHRHNRYHGHRGNKPNNNGGNNA